MRRNRQSISSLETGLSGHLKILAMGCSDVLKTCAELALHIFNVFLFIGGIVVLAFGALMSVKVRGAKIRSLDST